MKQVIPDTHAALMAVRERGAIDPLIGATLPLSQAPTALARLADRDTVGKVVPLPTP